MPSDGRESDLRRVLYGMAGGRRATDKYGMRRRCLVLYALQGVAGLLCLLQGSDARRSSNRVRNQESQMSTRVWDVRPALQNKRDASKAAVSNDANDGIWYRKMIRDWKEAITMMAGNDGGGNQVAGVCVCLGRRDETGDKQV